MYHSKQFEYPTHGNCANFRNGFCTLAGVVVNPNDPACPNFTPKSMMRTPEIEAYPAQPLQYPFAYMSAPWETYGHLAYQMYTPYFVYPWSPYDPLTYGYSYQPYLFSYIPLMPPLQSIEELRMLEMYKEELQAEIEAVDARIKELRSMVERR